jgi:hypothetical protein
MVAGLRNERAKSARQQVLPAGSQRHYRKIVMQRLASSIANAALRTNLLRAADTDCNAVIGVGL